MKDVRSLGVTYTSFRIVTSSGTRGPYARPAKKPPPLVSVRGFITHDPLSKGEETMIPTPVGPGDLPAIPERPVPLRVTPPPATSLWEELEELQRKVRELTERLEKAEERLVRLEEARK